LLVNLALEPFDLLGDLSLRGLDFVLPLSDEVVYLARSAIIRLNGNHTGIVDRHVVTNNSTPDHLWGSDARWRKPFKPFKRFLLSLVGCVDISPSRNHR